MQSLESFSENILYEDNHVIAVFKPSRLLVQGDSTGDASLMDLTKSYLKEKYKKPGNVYLGLVHRLDRPVAGVVLLAKTSKAASRLSESFRDREVKKTYWAVVEGVVNPPSQTLTGQLEVMEDRSIMVEAPEGKWVQLSFVTLKAGKESTLIEIDLATGRKHQIRCQLSHIRHPIMGDVKYGSKTQVKGVIALLSKSIDVPHPVKEERLKIEVPPALWKEAEWLK